MALAVAAGINLCRPGVPLALLNRSDATQLGGGLQRSQRLVASESLKRQEPRRQFCGTQRKARGGESQASTSSSGEIRSSGTKSDAEWLELLPEPTSALYSCSLPGIEAWLRSLGFQQLPVRPEEWRLEKDTWHAELSLDVTELCVRYTTLDKQSGGSGNRSSVERRFSYALSRQDLENAILAGP